MTGNVNIVLASHHGWRVSEVFSNADGTLQFIELNLTADGHDGIKNFLLVAGNGATKSDNVFKIPSNISGSLSGAHLLFATSGFQSAFGIVPDYTIPDEFLTTSAGDAIYAGITASRLVWTSLPTDGVNSMNTIPGGTEIALATPTNFSGVTVILSAADAINPVISNVPGSALVIVSNSAVPASNQQIVTFLAPISCTDETDLSPDLVINTPASFPAGQTTNVPISCTDDGGNTSSSQAQVTVSAFTDTDGDGVGNDTDDDDDNDGVNDTDDAFPLNDAESVDTDGDGIGNNADFDDDADGAADNVDDFPLDSTESIDTDDDGTGNNADTDDDGDGVDDDNDVFPLDKTESEDTDGDGTGNGADNDDDGDGVLDADDAFPLDENESVDNDGDGIGDNADTDDDEDGVADEDDAFPLDSTETLDTDQDGTGNNADTDDDGDGVIDEEDAFPLDDSEDVDTDADGVGNNADSDDDDDGIIDEDDAFPLDATRSEPDAVDTDDDGVIDLDDNCIDTPNADQSDLDADGLGNVCDSDDDGDGVADSSDDFPNDASETVDLDNDGVGNNADTDDDGDAIPDTDDDFPLDNTETVDTDGDGIGNNADQDDDNDGVADTDDAFPLDSTRSDDSIDTDGDGISDNADTDDDGDGIPDTVEIANNLDPLTAADALLDSDGDGLSNLVEHQQGSNILLDDVPPVITLTSPWTTAATGRFTAVEFSAITAIDVKDGPLTFSTNPSGPYVSGIHDLEVTAVDSAGNVAIVKQVLMVEPLLAISAGQRSDEGNRLQARISLIGTAPVYPVNVSYVVSGTASTSDYTGLTGNVAIDSGVSGVIEFDIVTDNIVEDDETLIITLTSAEGAVLSAVSHTVTITEENIPPTGVIEVRQADQKRVVVSRIDGPVEVSILASDNNPGDVLSIDWSETLALNLSPIDQVNSSFDPSTLPEGEYRLRVTISDDDDLPAVVRVSRLIQIVDGIASLSASVDSDGDGISDAEEGHGDSDSDGIEDYLDNNNDPTILPLATSSDENVMWTEAGLQLKLGDISIASNQRSAIVSDEDVSLLTDDTQQPLDNTEDSQFEHPLQLVDFKIDLLSVAGQTVRVVIPLPGSIPPDATYRKYSEISGWQDFVEDGINLIESASDSQGICPPIGGAYEEGLLEGKYCLQLTIVDGGLNDADGSANRSISDPGGIAVPILDLVAPVLLLPVGLSLTSSQPIADSDSRITTFLDSASCSDDVAGELTVSNDAPGSFQVGTVTTVSFTCLDSAQNITTSSATVTVSPEASTSAALTSANEEGGGGAGCFIATAAFGSTMEPELITLRRFRDQQLLTTQVGRTFVEFYYHYSPPVAEVISRHELLRTVTRFILVPFVYAVSDPAKALFLLLLLATMTLMVRFTRKSNSRSP